MFCLILSRTLSGLETKMRTVGNEHSTESATLFLGLLARVELFDVVCFEPRMRSIPSLVVTELE
jgi:hypothetical protein